MSEVFLLYDFLKNQLSDEETTNYINWKCPKCQNVNKTLNKNQVISIEGLNFKGLNKCPKCATEEKQYASTDEMFKMLGRKTFVKSPQSSYLCSSYDDSEDLNSNSSKCSCKNKNKEQDFEKLKKNINNKFK